MADTKIPRSGARVSLRSNHSISVLRIPSQSQLSQASQGSLHRSVSQLLELHDKKVLVDDALWETIMGHDSGLVSAFSRSLRSTPERDVLLHLLGAASPSPGTGHPLALHPAAHWCRCDRGMSRVEKSTCFVSTQ